MKIKEGEWLADVIDIEYKLNPAISLKIITGENDLQPLRDEWNKAAAESSGTIYQTFEWLYYWWKYFGKEKQYVLNIIFIYSDGKGNSNPNNLKEDKTAGRKLICIAPFFIHNRSLRNYRIYRQLKLIGSGLLSGQTGSYSLEVQGLSDYLDIICVKNFEKTAAETLAGFLTHFRNFFDEINFQNVSKDSFIFSYLVPLLPPNEFEIKINKTDVCPELNVPQSFDNLMNSVRPGTRRKIRQAIKQVSENEACKIEEVKREHFDSAMEILCRLHQKRWNEIGFPGLFSDNRILKFQSEVNKEFLKKGWLWFKVLKAEGKIISARLGYIFNNKMYDYLSGFDIIPSPASLRPGFILILSMIKDAVSIPLDVIDFLRGTEEYKFEISSTIKFNYNLAIKHTGKRKKIKDNLFKFLKLKSVLLFRLKNESAIILVHKNRYGKTAFIKPYLKFYCKRLKTFLNKSKKDNDWIRETISIERKNSFHLESKKGKSSVNKTKKNLYEIEI